MTHKVFYAYFNQHKTEFSHLNNFIQTHRLPWRNHDITQLIDTLGIRFTPMVTEKKSRLTSREKRKIFIDESCYQDENFGTNFFNNFTSIPESAFPKIHQVLKDYSQEKAVVKKLNFKIDFQECWELFPQGDLRIIYTKQKGKVVFQEMGTHAKLGFGGGGCKTRTRRS